MRGLQKSKRVSWASDLNLCQVKLFLSDESPSQVGLGGQDHLQAKDSWSWHSGGASSDDNLPPGFEGIQPANLLQNKLSQIPVIQWKCPSRFILDPTWQVAAGEESKEVQVESQREMRMLEAIYPRPSAVPPNPAPAMGADELYYSDQHTPVIPVTPIEDEDTAPDTHYAPPNRVGPVPVHVPAPVSVPNLQTPLPPLPEVNPNPPAKKDINYYKSLIQQHGGDKPEAVNNNNNNSSNQKTRDMKPKSNKPCIYFNSSRGCRHGANCVFQHDSSSSSSQRINNSLQDAQSAKRMKMDREITGT
ncbi:putative transcription factor C3H family [Helianthus annuus]|nr:putative transcription factor C3H family [Helianthus annuus]